MMEIIVRGVAKSGKTTLAREIAAALRHCGFPVNYDGDTDALPPSERTRRVEAIRCALQDSCSAVTVREEGVRPQPTRLERHTIYPPSDHSEGGHCD
jgi:molybdopterin-guanine dinucleotide biosynthesis protein